jgi:segregation and condensation protein A
MEQLSYRLEVFEGPLDVLLMLIAKNKLNIYDIPIAQLLDQYMEQIRQMQSENMDLASEFLEMAARLVYIKSLSLLPKREEEEELKRELTGQLLEYKLCKEMAQNLACTATFDKLVRETAEVPADLSYKRKHSPFDLVKGYLNAVGRGKRFLPPPRERFSEIVSRKFVSVSSQVVYVLRQLFEKKELPFSSLFAQKTDSSERVAAFLAVLELIKGKRIRVENKDEEIKVRLLDGGGDPESERVDGDSGSDSVRLG